MKNFLKRISDLGHLKMKKLKIPTDLEILKYLYAEYFSSIDFNNQTLWYNKKEIEMDMPKIGKKYKVDYPIIVGRLNVMNDILGINRQVFTNRGEFPFYFLNIPYFFSLYTRLLEKEKNEVRAKKNSTISLIISGIALVVSAWPYIVQLFKAIISLLK